MDKTAPINTEVTEQKLKDKLAGIFIIFILPILLIISLYYFSKIYKNDPIIYIIFLILTIIYTLLDSLYIYMGIISHGF